MQARVQYGRQLNKSDYGVATVRFADATTPQRAADVHGVGISRNYVNLGVGANWKLREDGSMLIYATYDADIYSRTTVHSGELGISLRW